MNVPTPTEIAVDLARENERQKITIKELSEQVFDLRNENERLKQELEKHNK